MRRLHPAALLCALLSVGCGSAQDWSGPFTIIPVSAPEMALEAVGAGDAAGTVVSIGHPDGKPHQQWFIGPSAEGWYPIRTATNAKLVLSAEKGGTKNGTLIVLEEDTGQPWQRWAIRKNAGGSFCLVPKHAPQQGLDDFGGHQEPGSRQDLWTCNPDDEHLQWLLRPLPGATWPAAAGDLSRPLPPRGSIQSFWFEGSRIYPGTRRNVTVFIPAQYDGSRPACVYVRQDGYLPREKSILEALIAAGEMPVTVGVFVRPGDVAAPMKGTMGRRNRCFEYDGVSDNYVRHLTEEMLPAVAAEYKLKLSSSGNDRCIAGGSSGGIAAFCAAWQRPDAFSRVYANSGSFVAFRGGHEFPTLVRKFEAQPIRAYLTCGTHDMENCAGDWFLLDQEMDKALKFSGYDYRFKALDGPHVAGWLQEFAEAMRFIWQGWPAPVKPGPSAPRVRDVIVEGSPWTAGPRDLGQIASPVVNSKGEVFFVDRKANRIGRLNTDGKASTWLPDAAHADGLAVGPKDELYTVSAGTGCVLCYEAGAAPKRVLEGLPGNFVLARPDGSLYITDSAAGQVWLVKDGRKTLVDSGLKQPTGLALRPDQWLLAVAEGGSKWLCSYQVQPDGTLVNKERFFWLHVPDWEDDAGAQSACYAKEGQLLVATHYGVQICADDGPTQVILPVPDRQRVTGVCLGGAKLDTLYAFCGNRVWQRSVKVHGVGAFSPWQAVRGTPL